MGRIPWAFRTPEAVARHLRPLLRHSMHTRTFMYPLPAATPRPRAAAPAGRDTRQPDQPHQRGPTPRMARRSGRTENQPGRRPAETHPDRPDHQRPRRRRPRHADLHRSRRPHHHTPRQPTHGPGITGTPPTGLLPYDLFPPAHAAHVNALSVAAVTAHRARPV